MKTLTTLPDGVNEAFVLVERFDEALLHGFARLGEGHREQLEAPRRGLQRLALGDPVAEAVAAVGRSEFVARYFLALASARVALLERRDALVAQAREALDRPSPAVEEAIPAADRSIGHGGQPACNSG